MNIYIFFQNAIPQPVVPEVTLICDGEDSVYWKPETPKQRQVVLPPTGNIQTSPLQPDLPSTGVVQTSFQQPDVNIKSHAKFMSTRSLSLASNSTPSDHVSSVTTQKNCLLRSVSTGYATLRNNDMHERAAKTSLVAGMRRSTQVTKATDISGNKIAESIGSLRDSQGEGVIITHKPEVSPTSVSHHTSPMTTTSSINVICSDTISTSYAARPLTESNHPMRENSKASVHLSSESIVTASHSSPSVKELPRNNYYVNDPRIEKNHNEYNPLMYSVEKRHIQRNNNNPQTTPKLNKDQRNIIPRLVDFYDDSPLNVYARKPDENNKENFSPEIIGNKGRYAMYSDSREVSPAVMTPASQMVTYSNMQQPVPYINNPDPFLCKIIEGKDNQIQQLHKVLETVLSKTDTPERCNSSTCSGFNSPRTKIFKSCSSQTSFSSCTTDTRTIGVNTDFTWAELLQSLDDYYSSCKQKNSENANSKPAAILKNSSQKSSIIMQKNTNTSSVRFETTQASETNRIVQGVDNRIFCRRTGSINECNSSDSSPQPNHHSPAMSNACKPSYNEHASENKMKNKYEQMVYQSRNSSIKSPNLRKDINKTEENFSSPILSDGIAVYNQRRQIFDKAVNDANNRQLGNGNKLAGNSYFNGGINHRIDKECDSNFAKHSENGSSNHREVSLTLREVVLRTIHEDPDSGSENYGKAERRGSAEEG